MTLLRFVLHEEIPAYEAEGWIVSSDMAGSYHGGFSVLMELPEDDAQESNQ